MADDLGVLVVGAGPVGLTMACEAARHGLPCRIIDDGGEPTSESRALGIQARTLEVFEDVGVVDEVLAKARKARGAQIFAEKERILQISFDLDGLETHYPFLLILPQSETERILLARLREHGVEVEWKTSMKGFAQDGRGVSATIAGPDGATSDIRARWLVGCDGARSLTRKTLGLDFAGKEYEETFLLADVRLDWDRPDDEFTIVLTPQGPIVAFPMPEPGRWRLIDGSGQSADDAEPARVVAWFQGLLREHGRPEAVVSDPIWTSAFRLHRRVVDRFRSGRCFVAGDAAHIHSPAGGQGMNTGIQDAYNLAWKLALVDRGASPDSLLDSYTPERRPTALGVLNETDTMTRIVTLRNPVARSVRNHLASILGEFDFFSRKVAHNLSELGVAYHGSPIVAEDRPGAILAPAEAHAFRRGPKPGDRVPDVHLDAPGLDRLHRAILGTKHVLLLFGEVDPAVGDLAARHAAEVTTYRVAPGEAPGEGTIADPDGHLARRLGVRSTALYLIRPDGYVAYRAEPADAAEFASYLGRIFVAA